MQAQSATRQSTVAAIGQAAGQIAALGAAYGMGAEKMEEVSKMLDAMPRTTGTERAAARLAIKRAANALIPTIDRPPSRQVRRAAERRRQKRLKQHRNEVVLKKNVKR